MARLTFYGAAGVVTGSKHLLETDAGARVLLDCGMFQGLRELTERCLDHDPAKRYQTAESLREAMTGVLRGM